MGLLTKPSTNEFAALFPAILHKHKPLTLHFTDYHGWGSLTIPYPETVGWSIVLHVHVLDLDKVLWVCRSGLWLQNSKTPSMMDFLVVFGIKSSKSRILMGSRLWPSFPVGHVATKRCAWKGCSLMWSVQHRYIIDERSKGTHVVVEMGKLWES